MKKIVQFTLDEYKTAVLNFQRGQSMSEREREICSEVLIRDLSRRSQILKGKQDQISEAANSLGNQSANSLSQESSETDGNGEGVDGDNDKPPPDDLSPTRKKKTPRKRQFESTYTHPLASTSNTCEKCYCRLSLTKPKVIFRVTSTALFTTEKHQLETKRCIGCGLTVSADPGFDVQGMIGQFTSYAAAVLIVLHYYMGMPFNRLSRFLSFMNGALPSSSQWDVASQSYDRLKPMYIALWLHSRESAKNMRVDDSGAKILSTSGKIRDGTTGGRSGVNATALKIMTHQNEEISLFITGLQHGGEVVNTLLHARESNKQIIKISDAANKNFALSAKSKQQVIEAACNEHAFAMFRSLRNDYPTHYQFVAETYNKIYELDRLCKSEKLNDEERLRRHQKTSLPLMAKFAKWTLVKLNSGTIEENSNEGRAFHYVINQFAKLTEFLKTPGVPLDTNLVEQFLRVSKRYFRNSSFFKTDTGAEVGDMFMSLTRTAIDAGVSPIDYICWCLDNHEDLKMNPNNYFPWMYASKLKQEAKAA